MDQHAEAREAPPREVMAPVSAADIAHAVRLAPAWINAIRVRQTLDALQPYYPDQRLCAEDAVEIMTRMGKLFELLSTDREAGGCAQEDR